MSAEHVELDVDDPFDGVDFASSTFAAAPRTLLIALLSAGAIAAYAGRLHPAVLGRAHAALARRPEAELARRSPQLPPAALEQGGGFGNAIVGTLIDRRPWRSSLSVPIGC